MSIDFSVCVNELISVQELRAGIPEVMSKMTGALISPPVVHVMDQGIELEINDNSILEHDSLAIVLLEDHDSKVSLLTVESLALTGHYQCVASPYWSRSPVEFVLAICCAIWIAKRFDRNIIDESGFWIDQREFSAEYILNVLSVQHSLSFEKACDWIVGKRLD